MKKLIGRIGRRLISMLRFWRFWNIGVFLWVRLDGKLLLVKSRDQGTWGLPGGEVDPRRDQIPSHYSPPLKDCPFYPFYFTADRELDEEVGLRISQIDPTPYLCAVAPPFPLWPLDLAVCYLVIARGPKRREVRRERSPEISDLGFFTRQEAEDLPMGARMRALVREGFSRLFSL